MTWKFTLNKNHKRSKEYSLTLSQVKHDKILRRWFGPMAQHLFSKIKNKQLPHSTQSSLTVTLDKQAAQYFLIKASFFHQQCLQQYQVLTDLIKHGIETTEEVIESLLYIRMTCLHPSQQNIHLMADCQLACSLHIDHALDELVKAKLIQKIEFLHFKFYDKNPYPHGHIFDKESQTLRDHNNIELLGEHQRLIS